MKKKAAAKKTRVKSAPVKKPPLYLHDDVCICGNCSESRRERWRRDAPEFEPSWSPDFAVTVIGLMALSAAVLIGLFGLNADVSAKNEHNEKVARQEATVQILAREWRMDATRHLDDGR